VLSKLPIIMGEEARFLLYSTTAGLAKPANYNTIMETNRVFGEIGSNEAELLEAGPNRCTLTKIV